MRSFIIALALLLSAQGFAYNQKISASRTPLKYFGVSAGFGIAGNFFGIKPQAAIHESLAIIMPLSVTYAPKIDALELPEILRAHGGLGLRWHIAEKIDRDAWYLEPVMHAGLSKFSDEKYLALKPSLSFGYAWIYDSGFSFTLGLTGHYEFIMGQKGSALAELEQRTIYKTLINLPVVPEMTFGCLF